MKVVEEVIFIDEETLNDYNSYKANFLRLNKNRDAEYDFSEYIESREIKEINMIKLSEKEPPFIGLWWFCLFNLLSLAAFYKLYIWLISIHQTIIIRKIITNRNEVINDPIYNRYNPQFKFLDKIIKYEHNSAQRELPMNEDNSNENIFGYNNININNLNQLNRNNINNQIKKNNSLSTKYSSNISGEES